MFQATAKMSRMSANLIIVRPVIIIIGLIIIIIITTTHCFNSLIIG